MYGGVVCVLLLMIGSPLTGGQMWQSQAGLVAPEPDYRDPTASIGLRKQKQQQCFSCSSNRFITWFAAASSLMWLAEPSSHRVAVREQPSHPRLLQATGSPSPAASINGSVNGTAASPPVTPSASASPLPQQVQCFSCNLSHLAR